MANWTEENIQIVKTMWLIDGCSASQIARYLNNGVSRNAVIGIIHRHNWQRPGVQAGARPNRMKSTKTREPRQPSVPQPNKEEQVAALRLAAGDLEALGPMNDFPKHGCRYVHGDPINGEWQCCGHTTELGRSWCKHHMAVVYDKVRTEQANQRWRNKQTSTLVFADFGLPPGRPANSSRIIENDAA